MTNAGRLTTCYTAHCFHCGQTLTLVAPTRADAHRNLKLGGWRCVTRVGWFCPTCAPYARKEKV